MQDHSFGFPGYSYSDTVGDVVDDADQDENGNGIKDGDDMPEVGWSIGPGQNSRSRSLMRRRVWPLLFAVACSKEAPNVAPQLEASVDVEGGVDGVADADSTAPDCRHPGVTASCVDGLCRIEAGCFLMGSPPDEWGRGRNSEDEVPVTLTHSFFIGQHEVTRKDWAAIGLVPPPLADPGAEDIVPCVLPDCPIAKVSWFDALEYANRLSLSQSPPLPACYELTGCTGTVGSDFECSSATPVGGSIYTCRGYRLPTEAEWEYATRAGTRSAFFSGAITANSSESVCGPDPNLEAIGWYCFNSGNTVHPVMQKKANGWGLFDVSGNVMEWVNDGYDPLGYYGGKPATDPNPTFPFRAGTDDRVNRGGKANRASFMSRSALRFYYSRSTRGWTLGFRIARTE